MKVNHKHYESYPVNTIEGNSLVRAEVHKRKILNLRYITISAAASIAVGAASGWIAFSRRELFLGWVWGTFLIVITTHLSNLVSYLVSRKGLEGKIRMHLRTGYLIQSGRYFAWIPMMPILWLVSMSSFILGVFFTTLTSSIRQLLWLCTIPTYDESEQGNRVDG